MTWFHLGLWPEATYFTSLSLGPHRDVVKMKLINMCEALQQYLACIQCVCIMIMITILIMINFLKCNLAFNTLTICVYRIS